MARLCPATHARVFHLDKVANARALFDDCRAAKMCERSYRHALTDDGILYLRLHNLGVICDAAVRDKTVGADDASTAYRGASLKVRLRMNGRVGFNLDGNIDIRVRGVNDRDASQHVLLENTLLQNCARGREFNAIVDTHDVAMIFCLNGHDGGPQLREGADAVGKVE